MTNGGRTLQSTAARCLHGVGWLVTLGAGWVVASVLIGIIWPWPTVVLQSALPYLVGPVLVVLIVGAATRRLGLATTSAVVTVISAALVVPVLRARPVPSWAAGQGDIRVLSANVLYLNDRYTEMLDVITRTDPEVVALTEVTPSFLDALKQAGLDTRYPHALASVPDQRVFSSVLRSKFPLTNQAATSAGAADIVGQVQVGKAKLTIVVVHARAPSNAAALDEWNTGLRTLSDASTRWTGPIAMVGDFNATYWHPPMRQLLGTGFASGHRDRGKGLTMSWPLDSWFTFTRLDHVLTKNDAVAARVVNVVMPGSDHLGFVVDLAVRQ